MNAPRALTGNGHLGVCGAVTNVYIEALEQGCWNHKLLNVLDKLPKKTHGQAKNGLRKIFYNVVESSFAALRLRTDAAKRYKKVYNATAVICKMPNGESCCIE